MTFAKKVVSVVMTATILFGTVCVALADAETVEAVLYSSEGEVTYYAPCETDFQIKLPKGCEFAGNEGIKVYNAGNSVFYDSADSVDFSAIASDNILTISLKSAPIDGNKYKIVLPDDFSDKDGNRIEPKEFVFKAKAGETKLNVETKVNFSGLSTSDLNYIGVRPSNDYVIGNSGFKFTKTSSGTRNEIVEETGCSGDKALKITDRGVVANDINDGLPYKFSKLKFDIRFKVIKGELKLCLGNGAGSTQIFWASPTETKIFSQDTIEADSTGTASTAPESGYVTLSYEIDLSNSSVTKYTINGIEGSLDAGKLPRYDGNINLLSEGISFISFENTKSKGEYLLDYLNYTILSEKPDVKEVSFTDEGDEAVKYSPQNALTPSIKTVNISFINKMDKNSLKNISITDFQNVPIAYSGEFDEKSLVYKMNLTGYLKENNTYQLNIPDTVLSNKGIPIEEITETFETESGKFEITALYLTDSAGNKIEKLKDVGTGFTVKADIVNTIGKNGNVTIVYTDRTGMILNSFQYESFSITSNKTKDEISFAPIKTVGADEIKCFLWSDIENHIPISDHIVIK